MTDSSSSDDKSATTMATVSTEATSLLQQLSKSSLVSSKYKIGFFITVHKIDRLYNTIPEFAVAVFKLGGDCDQLDTFHGITKDPAIVSDIKWISEKLGHSEATRQVTLKMLWRTFKHGQLPVVVIQSFVEWIAKCFSMYLDCDYSRAVVLFANAAVDSALFNFFLGRNRAPDLNELFHECPIYDINSFYNGLINDPFCNDDHTRMLKLRDRFDANLLIHELDDDDPNRNVLTDACAIGNLFSLIMYYMK